jgi:hypothetical protein
MKIWKSLIRVWLTLISLISFLVGWVVLAHAPKPNQFNPASVPAAPKLAPVPSLAQVMNSDQSQNFFNVQSAQPIQRRPFLRSGGS